MRKTHKNIKDPSHGFISLTDLQQDLIEQPELQRLAWIKQLGLTFLVYPGAHQTRLEHSLGASNLTRQISQNLELKEQDEKNLEATALLHDLGHAPFSHSIEPLMEKDHMEVTKEIIKGDIEVAPESGEIPHILDKHGLNPDEVANLVTGDREGKKYLNQLINSQMDVDQLDYLTRDAYYTGVTYGSIETQRIINTMTISQGEITYLEKGIDALENYLLAKDHMYSSVYIHKTVSIAEKMLLRATERAKSNKLYRKTDGELLEELKHSNEYSNHMVNRIIYRNLYKQSYTIKNTDPQEKQEKLREIKGKQEKQIEREIAKEANLKQDEVIINRANEMLKESEPRLRQFNIKINKKGKLTPIEDLSEVVKSLKKKKVVRNIFSVYTTPENREKVKQATKNYLNQ